MTAVDHLPTGQLAPTAWPPVGRAMGSCRLSEQTSTNVKQVVSLEGNWITLGQWLLVPAKLSETPPPMTKSIVIEARHALVNCQQDYGPFRIVFLKATRHRALESSNFVRQSLLSDWSVQQTGWSCLIGLNLELPKRDIVAYFSGLSKRLCFIYCFWLSASRRN